MTKIINGVKVHNSYVEQLGDAAKFLLNKDWLYEHYVTKNWSTRKIGKNIGCGKKAVNTALRRFDIALGTFAEKVNSKEHSRREFLKNAPPHVVGKIDNYEWLKKEYLVQNKSVKEIAEELNLHISTVMTWVAQRHKFKKSAKDQLACSQRRYKELNGFSISSIEACRKRMAGKRACTINTVKGGKIYCHSSWETIIARELDCIDFVKSFAKDAVIIPYKYNNNKHLYFVDFEVCLINDKKLLIEVKATKLLEMDDRTNAKIEVLEEYSQTHKCDWLLIDGKNKVNVHKLHDYFRFL